MPLLALFVVLPAVELYILIALGAQVGAPATLGLILLTGFIGAGLVRQQGLGVYRRIQQESAAGRLPAIELVEGLVLLVCGALLVTPGLLTDAVGFAALVPALRRRFAKGLADRIVVGGSGAGFQVGFGGPFPGGGPFGGGSGGPGGRAGAPFDGGAGRGPFGGGAEGTGGRAGAPFGGGSGSRPFGGGRGDVVDVESRPVDDDDPRPADGAPRALGPRDDEAR